MQMALADVTNGTNQLDNFKIEFVPLDNASASSGLADPAQEASNANKAASDPDAMLYLGPTGTATAQVAIPILNRAGLVMISPGTTYPGLTKGVANITKPDEPGKYYPTNTRNYFRLLPTDELQGRADASYTEAKLQKRKVFVVEDESDYGVGLAKAYEGSASYYNLNLLGHASLVAAPDNTEAVVSQIRAADPEVIFYSGSSRPAAQLVTKVRAAGIKAEFLSGGSIQDDTFGQVAGAAGEGAYSSNSGIAAAGLSARGAAFLKEYRDKYGDTLQANTIYGYDAMNAGLAAIKQAGKKERGAILKAVAGLKNFTGVTGRWSFDQDGDTSLTVFAFYTYKGQKWIFDSVADTSPVVQPGPRPGAGPTPTAPAPLGPLTPGASPPPTRGGAVTLAPSTPGPDNKRVDAVSKLPSEFKLYKIANLPLAIYVPPGSGTSSKPITVLVALHGMFANGGDFGLPLLDFAEKNGLVLIAPTFNYNVNYKNPEVIANEDLELTGQLMQVFKQLPQTLKLNLGSKVLLFGFSRGAQLAHHFALFYPQETLGVAVLSGGAYTLPLSKLNDQFLPYPFGVGNFNDFTHHNFAQTDFVKIPFDVQVGALDNDPSQVSRPYDPYIGNNRVARAQTFYRALNTLGVKAEFKLEPNTQHEVNLAQLEDAEQFLQNYVSGG
jgi:branched-chain amino acid transport system substrate-binding protein